MAFSIARSCFLFCAFVVFLPGAVHTSAEPTSSTITEEKRPQAQDVVSVLRNAGGYELVATLLDAMDIAILPSNTTILAPDDKAASQLESLTFAQATPILQYHVLTRELPFNDLVHMNVGSRIDTLLKNHTVKITSNSIWHFTLDNVKLINPDLFYNNGFVIHGLDGILNFSLFYSPAFPVPRPPPPNATLRSPSPTTAPSPPPNSSPNARPPSSPTQSSTSPSPSVANTPASTMAVPAEAPTPRLPRFPTPSAAPKGNSMTQAPTRAHSTWTEVIIIVSFILAAGLSGVAIIFLTWK